MKPLRDTPKALSLLKTARLRRYVSMLVVLFCLLPGPATGQTADSSSRRVLVLNSYHPQYPWTDLIVAGIYDEIADMINKEALHVEYMDTRRFIDDPSYIRILIETYRHKYAGKYKPDLIISSDDNALDFLMTHHGDLFPHIPVVFCGLNHHDEAAIADRDHFTGLFEGLAVEENLDLIVRLHPKVKQIVLLSDRSSMGDLMTSVARPIIDRYQETHKVAIKIWDDFSLTELRRSLQDARPGTVFLMMAIHKDRNGAYFSYDEHLGPLTRVTPVPVYGMWGFLLGKGVVGGMMNDGYRHGRNAAKLGRRILNGESPAHIPLVPSAEYLPRLDYRQLVRFNVDLGALPAGAVVTNKPVSFYEQHRTKVWSVTAGFVCLIATIAFLFRALREQQRAEGANRRLAKVVEQSSDAMAITDVYGHVEYANSAYRARASQEAEEARNGIPTELRDFHLPVHIRPEVLQAFERNSSWSERVERKDERNKRLIEDIRLSAIRNRRGRITNLVVNIRNITQEVDMLEHINRSQRMETVGRLAGGVAHDFNNLLVPILGSAELALLKLEPGGRAYYLVETILEAATRAKNLTRQLLLYGKKLPFVKRVTSANQVIARSGEYIENVSQRDR